MLGVPNHFGSFVSQGGHAYRQDIREAVFRFLNTHLKNDSSAVSDTEVDLPEGKKMQLLPSGCAFFRPIRTCPPTSSTRRSTKSWCWLPKLNCRRLPTLQTGNVTCEKSSLQAPCDYSRTAYQSRKQSRARARPSSVWKPSRESSAICT